MSDVVQNGGPGTDPPRSRDFRSSHRSPPRRHRVGTAIAFVFTVFAFIVVACSGDSGDQSVGDFNEQGQRICTPDGEGCGPPPRDPCGHDGEACCRLNNSCQSPLVCFNGVCSQCGVPGGPCCAGNSCQSDSTCRNGACERICGGAGLPCCTSGTQCDSNLACSGGTCQACGRDGQVCCPGNTCTQSGRQCVGGTCKLCGGYGQPCCPSGIACGLNLACQSGTCQAICGTPYNTCCGGFESQKCPFAGSGYACNPTFNRCEPCGSSGQPCCATGSACTFGNVCAPNPFGIGNTCQSCGLRGQPCCSGNFCSLGVCTSGKCQ